MKELAKKQGYYYVVLENGYTTIGLYTCMGWTYSEWNKSLSKFGAWPVITSFWKDFEGFNVNPFK
jgi:hypothetical protein